MLWRASLHILQACITSVDPGIRCRLPMKEVPHNLLDVVLALTTSHCAAGTLQEMLGRLISLQLVECDSWNHGNTL